MQLSPASVETMRRIRDQPPSHFVLKVQSYSSFVTTMPERYESAVFKAGGHKWRLAFYPRGKHNDNNYISVYLQMADTAKLSANWEVNVMFKLFIHDQIRDKYLVVQDADVDVRRFYAMKTEWGFEDFLPMMTFKDATNGYLVNDCCVFGAEVFVIQKTQRGEILSMKKLPGNGTYTWKINNFSQWNRSYYFSYAFVVGGFKWMLLMYPKGNSSGQGNSLSVYLYRNDRGGKIYAAYTVRLKDHLQEYKRERSDGQWFGGSRSCWGFSDFISLKDLNNYIKYDSLTLECQITQLSVLRNFKY